MASCTITPFPLCTLEAAGSNYSLFTVSLISLVYWRLLWQTNAETTGGAEKTGLAGEEPVNFSGVFPSLVTGSQTLCRKHPARLTDWEGADKTDPFLSWVFHRNELELLLKLLVSLFWSGFPWILEWLVSCANTYRQWISKSCKYFLEKEYK